MPETEKQLEATAARHESGIRRVSSLMDAWWKIALIVGGLFFFIYQSIVAWLDIQTSVKQGKDNKEDIIFLQGKVVTKEELKAVDEKVTRQWTINSDANTRQDKEIQAIRDWIKFQEGFTEGAKSKK